ncbi:MAG TPA: lasso peptide biosynthesis PqqD family chaperone [Jatrophihabitantaceae bacterium]|nr:lasso peptide biosynthesis PqqD family chaperone [Jatrophihabitantaceae bacterium]
MKASIRIAETERGLILLDGRDGQYYELNDSAADMLRALIGGMTTADAARQISERYGVGTGLALTDLSGLIQRLTDLGMVTP